MSALRVLLAALVTGTALHPAADASGAELGKKTLTAWERYIAITEARIEAEIESRDGFLARDFLPAEEARECTQFIDAGEVCVSRMETRDASGRNISIPSGMIHHWLGSALVPNASLEDLLEWLQDYAKHEERFGNVEASRLLSREGDTFESFLRLKRDSVVTVHYNTEHIVEYRHHGPREVSSRSATTRIAQLANPGERSEREKPVGRDSGFLWRLNSYWRFQEVGEGVIVECESVGLSRGIPFAVRWLVSPFTASIPRESMESTLLSIRNGSVATMSSLKRVAETEM